MAAGANFLLFFHAGRKMLPPRMNKTNVSINDTRPMALIIPAKTHPDVIVYSIAARDKARATAYAKKHGIPHVRDSYQGEVTLPPARVGEGAGRARIPPDSAR